MDSVFFCMMNLNKEGVTLNLKAERGRKMFEEMAKKADIVVENLGPGALDRLGLGYSALAKINPRIILASVKGFGSEGPYSGYKSFEMIAQAMSGVMSLTGSPDGPPMRIEAGLGDTGSGLHAAIGILAAIVQRQLTGVGQHVEVAQQDVVVNLTRIHYREHHIGVRPIPRKGNRSPSAAPSNIYRCRPFGPNDYAFIHTANEDMWKALTRVLGQPELANDPRFAQRADRVKNVEELESLIEGWTGKRTKHEVMELLGAAGVPCGAVLDSAEVLSDPHLRQRGFITELEHPRRGIYPMPGNPVRLSDSPTDMVRSPTLGEHNAEVYGKLLSLGQAELDTLRRDGVI
jgi:formyl-CoA transferase